MEKNRLSPRALRRIATILASCLLLWLARHAMTSTLVWPTLFGLSPAGAAGPYDLTTASFLGDASDIDSVRGARIQSDGTVVLAANIGSAVPGPAPTLLNGANATSRGAVLRLSADGQTVLSVTRLADRVLDLALDDNDNITVALWSQGLIKLDPTAGQVVWDKSPGKVMRVDAGGAGYVAALVTTAADPDDSSPGSGSVHLYRPDGTPLADFAGHRNTLDVCLDPATQTVAHIGWRQASAFDGSSTKPVQIAYLRGRDFAGAIKWTSYDWSTDSGADDFINKPTNNMADTRGYRCSIGADGKLYAAFETAGGNHIFRYSPFDIAQQVDIVGGDMWHEFYETRSEHKTFFARYEPASGAYLLGQQFTNRLTLKPGQNLNRGNTVRVRRGEIRADALGRVYIGGDSAYGLPMPPHPQYSAKAGQMTFIPPGTGDYVGGAWFMVMSADFKTRLYVTRLTSSGDTHALDSRILAGDAANIVFAGRTRNLAETYTQDAVQSSAGGGTQDGWLAVIAAGQGSSIEARFTASPTFGPNAPLVVDFDAGGSSSAGSSITAYDWNFGDGSSGSGQTTSHTYTTDGVYPVTLTITDDQARSATATRTIYVGGQHTFLPVILK